VLALAVLSMLTEEPMHAYRMQRLIKDRRKDDVVNVSQRNSVYQTIQRRLNAPRTGPSARCFASLTPDGRP
jgi:DNA-binding PadR family transcriptional regulator